MKLSRKWFKSLNYLNTLILCLVEDMRKNPKRVAKFLELETKQQPNFLGDNAAKNKKKKENSESNRLS